MQSLIEIMEISKIILVVRMKADFKQNGFNNVLFSYYGIIRMMVLLLDYRYSFDNLCVLIVNIVDINNTISHVQWRINRVW